MEVCVFFKNYFFVRFPWEFCCGLRVECLDVILGCDDYLFGVSFFFSKRDTYILVLY